MNEKVVGPIYEASVKYRGMWNGFTTCGHPVAAAIAPETIRIIEEGNLPENAARMGERLRKGFSKFVNHPLVCEVRGIGLLAGVELVINKRERIGLETVGRLGSMAAERMQANGIITRQTETLCCSRRQ